MMMISVGMENVPDIVFLFKNSSALFIDAEIKNFSKSFMPDEEAFSLRKQTCLNVHEKFITAGNFLFPNGLEKF